MSRQILMLFGGSVTQIFGNSYISIGRGNTLVFKDGMLSLDSTVV